MTDTLYEEKKRSGAGGFFFLAVIFFLLAAFFYVSFQMDSKARAEQIIRKIHTLDTTQGGFSWDFEKHPAMVERRYGKYLTEKGLRETLSCGLPVGLLVGDEGGRVERVYASSVKVQEIEDSDAQGSSFAAYRYEVEVEARYVKGFEVLARSRKSCHTGVIRMKKEGLSGWKLDSIKVG